MGNKELSPSGVSINNLEHIPEVDKQILNALHEHPAINLNSLVRILGFDSLLAAFAHFGSLNRLINAKTVVHDKQTGQLSLSREGSELVEPYSP